MKRFQYERVPDGQPDLLRLWSCRNIAIPASYFCVGACSSLLATPISIYMIRELNAQPQIQNTIAILMSVPWSFKLVYGFMSDIFPICGMQRKPYLFLGYMIYALPLLYYAFERTPSIFSLAVVSFVSTVGLIMGDVMSDAMVVERSKFEDEANKGQLQATCYAIRFFGGMLGSCAGALTFNQAEWGWGLTFSQICIICACLPIVLVIPFIIPLNERLTLDGRFDNKPVLEQMTDIWNTVKLKAVWRPMTFVYVFNIMQIPNVAWASYLQLSLEFQPWVLGLMAGSGSLMTFFGIMAFKRWFFRASWRAIYGWSVLFTTFFSAMQLLLIFQINTRYLHLNNYFFALGDDVITSYISGIQFLPLCLMYVQLCPHGSEGASYAMLTTFGNIAMNCASTIGSYMANIWDVSNESLKEHEYSGLWKLTLLTSLIALTPLPLLGLLPKDAEEQEDLKINKESSTLGGAVFLFVLGASLCWTLADAFMTLQAV